MLIILEGPDGGGKTRLLNTLRETLPHPAIFVRSNSRGDSRTLSAQLTWLHQANNPDFPLDLFTDRHPGISESIYGPILRGRSCLDSIPPEVGELVRGNLLIVYCRPPLDVLQQHLQVSDQREGVKENFEEIVRHYDNRMRTLERKGVQVFHHNYASSLERKHFTSQVLQDYRSENYPSGQTWTPRNRETESQKIKELYLKMGWSLPETPVQLDLDFLHARVGFLQEELNELLKAVDDTNWPEIVDALIDLVYVAKGTALQLGIDWDPHFDEVHQANLRKIPGINDKRPHLKYDLIKPDDWVPPDHLKILTFSRGN